MGKEFDIKPRQVAHVETKYRRIATPLPHPDSLATLERLRQFEPQSMRGQPPIVWDRAEDIFVYDKYGNRWLDWSSGVLVTNAGHARAGGVSGHHGPGAERAAAQLLLSERGAGPLVECLAGRGAGGAATRCFC